MSNNLNINWYPGHMAKTKRQIMEDLKLVDIIIEILDARIPISSQNPDINQITQNKKKIKNGLNILIKTIKKYY